MMTGAATIFTVRDAGARLSLRHAGLRRCRSRRQSAYLRHGVAPGNL